MQNLLIRYLLLISKKINSIIVYNEENKIKQKKSKNDYIHSAFIRLISIEKFLKIIIKYAEIEHNTLIVSYLNIIKLINKENFIRDKNKIYILLLSSSILSKKFLEDLILENSYYCQIELFSAKEMNMTKFNLLCKLL